MNLTTAKPPEATFSRIKLFLALSRTAHGVLDMATPALAALVWLGTFPPLHVIIIGLITTFAGYTAVYALNDVIDYRVDREKLTRTQLERQGGDLDALWVRHPMAQGMLSLREGILWVTGWSVVALIGAALLNPACIIIFLLGCTLEATYCILYKITHHRVIVSGGVKTSGAVAAVFAVDAAPDAAYLLCLFLLFFFWEIGGQNVPNDWADMEEDRLMNARTVPVRFGPDLSVTLILLTLILSTVLTPILFVLSRGNFEFPVILASVLAAGYLLILPAMRLWRTRESHLAMALFNKASCFPVALLVVVIVQLIF